MGSPVVRTEMAPLRVEVVTNQAVRPRARPQEHQAGGDGASADDDAEDGQEPCQIELDDV